MMLGLFAKQPVAGECKTRLAPGIGNEAAAELAAAFVRDTSARFGRVGSARCLAYAPPTTAARSFFEGSGNGQYELWPQPEGDLGVRLTAFFHEGLARFERVVVIGADSPTLPVTYVEEAFESLRERDCVLGPAADGGFYLVGLRRLHPDLFSGVEWSTPRVLEQIVERLRAAGFSLSLLPVWYDVDTWDDLQLLQGHLAAMRQTGQACDLPATAKILAMLHPDADR
jgi:hypothetical protein